MRKVPIIQTKSELYHMGEDKEADKIISSIDNVVGNEETIDILDKDESDSETTNEGLWTRIKNLFKK